MITLGNYGRYYQWEWLADYREKPDFTRSYNAVMKRNLFVFALGLHYREGKAQ
ncbi:hypothetical protein N476_15755 [Pseudoalteromonas luteoviolacea H33]|uniref:Uncharacterized protein n=1 Tax=Pseudoalteromonas luteoviolacea H33 TaxID=1365251 RepID=A0A167EH55_9GAMM|nr:hypothetical protein N476_15755 [Pseudoalteromonas luteoviolacea H33]KZN77687.1 hypothetical protein N477_12000 [Pseudoalteromonas luteoviolacea H33-S]